jgi:hypothetical protein
LLQALEKAMALISELRTEVDSLRMQMSALTTGLEAEQQAKKALLAYQDKRLAALRM